MDAFYRKEGDRLVAGLLTRGPWDARHQHAGPPAALLGRAIEDIPAPVPMQVARIAYDILRPIPIAALAVSTRMLRPGRSVELIEATLSDEQGPVMRATAWRIRLGVVQMPPGLPRTPAPPGPQRGVERPFFEIDAEIGYHTATEWRFLSGAWQEPGPATVWTRSRVALVEGEALTPLQRVLVAADSGNGVSATLDLRRHLFINTDLVVALHRMPAGEWVCLDAVTRPEPTGIGISDTALFDETGSIGRATQALLVAERPDGAGG